MSMSSLQNIESAIWRELQACIRDPAHAWRTPVLATSTEAGAADARVLVLREVEPQARLLRFFTDARSRKVAQIASRTQGVLVMWSPVLHWQLRLEVNLAMAVSGPAVSSRWDRLKGSRSAGDYLSALPPGELLDACVDGVPKAPTICSHGHFALLDASVRAIDWLALSTDGHRRARFEADGAHWLQP